MPKAKLQQEMIVEGLTEILFKAGKDEAIICIPGQKACFEPSQKYLNDTVTEKARSLPAPVLFLSDSCKNCDTFFSLSLQLRMFTCQHKNDLKTVLQSFLDIFVKDQGQGCMLVLYSLILSKGIDKYALKALIWVILIKKTRNFISASKQICKITTECLW